MREGHQTKYERLRSPREKNSGEILVERAGYISGKKRIEMLMLAGIKLKEFRVDQFDFDANNVDESYYDPTRKKNFDLADLSQMRRDLEEKVRIKKEQRKKEKEIADLEKAKKLKEFENFQNSVLKGSQTQSKASGDVLNEK